MVKIKKNLVLEGLVGAVNKKLVLKQYGKITIVSAYPDMSKVVKTKKQKQENLRFREAMAYAQSQMSDPVAKALYKAKVKGLQKPHNVAIADFYNPPEVKELDISKCHGQAGDLIFIKAIDDFSVEKVVIEIMDMNGSILESGSAQQTGPWKWEYQLTGNFPDHQNLIVRASAWDRPGNLATVQKTIVKR